jgi:hypothetical protein
VKQVWVDSRPAKWKWHDRLADPMRALGVDKCSGLDTYSAAYRIAELDAADGELQVQIPEGAEPLPPLGGVSLTGSRGVEPVEPKRVGSANYWHIRIAFEASSPRGVTREMWQMPQNVQGLPPTLPFVYTCPDASATDLRTHGGANTRSWLPCIDSPGVACPVEVRLTPVHLPPAPHAAIPSQLLFGVSSGDLTDSISVTAESVRQALGGERLPCDLEPGADAEVTCFVWKSWWPVTAAAIGWACGALERVTGVTRRSRQTSTRWKRIRSALLSAGVETLDGQRSRSNSTASEDGHSFSTARRSRSNSVASSGGEDLTSVHSASSGVVRPMISAATLSKGPSRFVSVARLCPPGFGRAIQVWGGDTELSSDGEDPVEVSGRIPTALRALEFAEQQLGVDYPYATLTFITVPRLATRVTAEPTAGVRPAGALGGVAQSSSASLSGMNGLGGLGVGDFAVFAGGAMHALDSVTSAALVDAAPDATVAQCAAAISTLVHTVLPGLNWRDGWLTKGLTSWLTLQYIAKTMGAAEVDFRVSCLSSVVWSLEGGAGPRAGLLPLSPVTDTPAATAEDHPSRVGVGVHEEGIQDSLAASDPLRATLEASKGGLAWRALSNVAGSEATSSCLQLAVDRSIAHAAKVARRAAKADAAMQQRMRDTAAEAKVDTGDDPFHFDQWTQSEACAVLGDPKLLTVLCAPPGSVSVVVSAVSECPSWSGSLALLALAHQATEPSSSLRRARSTDSNPSSSPSLGPVRRNSDASGFDELSAFRPQFHMHSHQSHPGSHGWWTTDSFLNDLITAAGPSRAVELKGAVVVWLRSSGAPTLRVGYRYSRVKNTVEMAVEVCIPESLPGQPSLATLVSLDTTSSSSSSSPGINPDLARETAIASPGGVLPLGAKLVISVVEDEYVRYDHVEHITGQSQDISLPCHSKRRRAIERQATGIKVDPALKNRKRRNAGRVRKSLLIDRVTVNDTPVRYFLVDPRFEIPGRALHISAPAALWRDALASEEALHAQLDAAAALGAIEATEPPECVAAGLVSAGADLPPGCGVPKDLQLQCFRDLKAVVVGSFTRVVDTKSHDDVSGAAGERVGAAALAAPTDTQGEAVSLGYGRKLYRDSVHVRHDVRVRVASAIALARWQSRRAPGLRTADYLPPVWRTRGSEGYQQSLSEIREQPVESAVVEAAPADVPPPTSSRKSRGSRHKSNDEGGGKDAEDEEFTIGSERDRWKRPHTGHLAAVAHARAHKAVSFDPGMIFGGEEDDEEDISAIGASEVGNNAETAALTSKINGRTLTGGGEAGEVTAAIALRPGVFSRKKWSWMGLHTLLLIYRQRFMAPHLDLPVSLSAYRVVDSAKSTAAARWGGAHSSSDSASLGNKIVGRFSRYALQQGLVTAIGRVRHSDGYTPTKSLTFLLRLLQGQAGSRALMLHAKDVPGMDPSALSLSGVAVAAAGVGRHERDGRDMMEPMGDVDGVMDVGDEANEYGHMEASATEVPGLPTIGGIDEAPYLCVLIRALLSALLDSAESRDLMNSRLSDEARRRRDELHQAQSLTVTLLLRRTLSAPRGEADDEDGVPGRTKDPTDRHVSKTVSLLRGIVSSELLHLEQVGSAARSLALDPASGDANRGVVAACAIRALCELDSHGIGLGGLSLLRKIRSAPPSAKVVFPNVSGDSIEYASLAAAQFLPLRVRVAALEGVARLRLGVMVSPPFRLFQAVVTAVATKATPSRSDLDRLRSWAKSIALPWMEWLRWVVAGLLKEESEMRYASLSLLRRLHVEASEQFHILRQRARGKCLSVFRERELSVAPVAPSTHKVEVGDTVGTTLGRVYDRDMADKSSAAPIVEATHLGEGDPSSSSSSSSKAVNPVHEAVLNSLSGYGWWQDGSEAELLTPEAFETIQGQAEHLRLTIPWWMAPLPQETDPSKIVSVDDLEDDFPDAKTSLPWLPWAGVWQERGIRHGMLTPVNSARVLLSLQAIVLSAVQDAPLIATDRFDEGVIAALRALSTASDAVNAMFSLLGEGTATDHASRRVAFHLIHSVFGRTAPLASQAFRDVVKVLQASPQGQMLMEQGFGPRKREREEDGMAPEPKRTVPPEALAAIVDSLVNQRLGCLRGPMVRAMDVDTTVRSIAESYHILKAEADRLSNRFGATSLTQDGAGPDAPVVTARGRKTQPSRLFQQSVKGLLGSDGESGGSDAEGDVSDGDWNRRSRGTKTSETSKRKAKPKPRKSASSDHAALAAAADINAGGGRRPAFAPFPSAPTSVAPALFPSIDTLHQPGALGSESWRVSSASVPMPLLSGPAAVPPPPGDAVSDARFAPPELDLSKFAPPEISAVPSSLLPPSSTG